MRLDEVSDLLYECSYLYSGTWFVCVLSPAVVDGSMAACEALPSGMKAVRLHKFGGPEVLQLDSDVPLPPCGAKEVDAVEFFVFLAAVHY